jgi:hypothetical protein
MPRSAEEKPPGGDEIAAETTDPSGTRVVLLARIWRRKVLSDHPEMQSLEDEVLRAVRSPDHVETDPVRGDRTRYFPSNVGPSRWLVAVVSYEQVPARLISAFAPRKDPPKWSA